MHDTIKIKQNDTIIITEKGDDPDKYKAAHKDVMHDNQNCTVLFGVPTPSSFPQSQG